ncbi:hypothetical protein QBC41DRAFT_133028 [Cercophora samala]|uniref:Uncharacterized protein n=1 Tax=Cercophora samala TaxID=330535 RepID=A0AA39ZC85_9PEZI|nr:hypothetical protein QBC41DRAFT_133028 [Cercophora samala]
MQRGLEPCVRAAMMGHRHLTTQIIAAKFPMPLLLRAISEASSRGCKSRYLHVHVFDHMFQVFLDISAPSLASAGWLPLAFPQMAPLKLTVFGDSSRSSKDPDPSQLCTLGRSYPTPYLPGPLLSNVVRSEVGISSGWGTDCFFPSPPDGLLPSGQRPLTLACATNRCFSLVTDLSGRPAFPSLSSNNETWEWLPDLSPSVPLSQHPASRSASHSADVADS